MKFVEIKDFTINQNILLRKWTIKKEKTFPVFRSRYGSGSI